jgi:hypothetical protein
MSTTKSSTGGKTFRIVSPLTTNGTMTVRDTSTGETYEIVDYTDELVHEKLSTRAKGSTVRLELAPARGTSGRRATRLLPGGLPGPGL